SQLAQVGITLKISAYPTPAEWSPAFTATPPPAAVEGPFGVDFASVYYDIFFGLDFPPNGWTDFSDPVLAQLETKAEKTPPDKAGPILKQMMGRTVTQAYFVPLTVTRSYSYYNRKLKGIEVNGKVEPFSKAVIPYGENPQWWVPAK